MTSQASTPIIYSVENGIARITLNRPDKRNAINGDLMQAIADAVDDIQQRDDMRALLIDATGPVFSAGIDLAYISSMIGSDGSLNMEAFETQVELLQGTITKIANLPIPSISLLQGICYGLGLELALGTDIRISTSECRIALPEIKLGLVSDCGGTTRLLQKGGRSTAAWMLLTGEEISGVKAEQLGLVHECADEIGLQELGMKRAEDIARRMPATIRNIKALIAASDTTPEHLMLQQEIEAQRKVLTRPEYAGYLMAGIAEMGSRRRS